MASPVPSRWLVLVLQVAIVCRTEYTPLKTPARIK
jgi:hypothetical protein